MGSWNKELKLGDRIEGRNIRSRNSFHGLCALQSWLLGCRTARRGAQCPVDRSWSSTDMGIRTSVLVISDQATGGTISKIDPRALLEVQANWDLGRTAGDNSWLFNMQVCKGFVLNMDSLRSLIQCWAMHLCVGAERTYVTLAAMLGLGVQLRNTAVFSRYIRPWLWSPALRNYEDTIIPHRDADVNNCKPQIENNHWPMRYKYE